MQRRVVALLIGAAAVLVLVVVLFFRVRSAANAPAMSPADLVAASHATHPEGHESAAASPPSSPLAPPKPRPPRIGGAHEEASTDDSPAEVGSRASAGARARARLRREEGEGGDLAQDLPADTPPEMVEKRRAVSDAYDTGDYETALRNAQEFLRFQAENEYVQRVAAVSACAIGDEASARVHYQQMSDSNQRIVQVRCRRFGINF